MSVAINYVVGDATAPADRPAIIAHIVNDLGKWGAGFVLAVSRRWRAPEAAYRTWHGEGGLKLGATQLVPVADRLWVANMAAQHGVSRRAGNPPIRYGALERCLAETAWSAAELGAGLHMPRIGCGLAGGDWATVEQIVRRTCCGVPVTVYDLPRT